MKTKIIAEIGINHNGNVDLAENLIRIAASAGCDYVKFQKRDVDICVPEAQKNLPKSVPWSKEPVTYLEYKRKLEFGDSEYRHLFGIAERIGVKPFASVWDEPSAAFMARFTDIVKIPSAKITDHGLLTYCKNKFKERMMSTGMSTEDEIQAAFIILQPQVMFHTNSAYPCRVEDLNLGYINWLRRKYPFVQCGFSNHYYGIVPAIATIAMGVSVIEVHLTENHSLWGSDHSSSIEPSGLFKLVKGIRDLEQALSKGDNPRQLYPGEEIKKQSLRG